MKMREKVTSELKPVELDASIGTPSTSFVPRDPHRFFFATFQLMKSHSACKKILNF